MAGPGRGIATPPAHGRRAAFALSLRGMAIAAVLTAAACAGSPPAGTPVIDVDFTWAGAGACSERSPRIVLRDVPPGTRRLRVELVDVDSVMAGRSASEIDPPADGVIRPGALANYRGPCGQQQSVTYELRVTALDGAGKTVGFGRKREIFVPPKLNPR